jgi:hypothetical protein
MRVKLFFDQPGQPGRGKEWRPLSKAFVRLADTSHHFAAKRAAGLRRSIREKRFGSRSDTVDSREMPDQLFVRGQWPFLLLNEE